MSIDWVRLLGIGRSRQADGRGRIPEWLTPFVGTPAIENEVAADPDAAPDERVRAFRGHARRYAVGSIRLLHQVPPIPPSLTRTGSLIVYFLRWKLSRSPPRRSLSVSWENRREFLDYILRARHFVSRAYQMLQIGDAVFGRRRRNTEEASQVNLSLVPCRETIAYCIMRSLLVLQAETQGRIYPRIYQCLLCGQAPSALQAENLPLENHVGTDILEVSRWRSPEGCSFIDLVMILSPIRADHWYLQDLFRELHRYVFQFLVYQNVNPSWPVPHVQQDRDRYGEIDVPRWNPATQTVHFEEPRRSLN